MRPMPSERGFYLIEVMVAVMLTSVGLLGMLALQARSISYAHDSQQRQNAILLAADLARSMQANREGLVREGKLRDDAAFLVAKGSAFPSLGSGASCVTSGLGASDRIRRELACWTAQVQRRLVTDDELLKDSTFICATRDGKSCASGSKQPLLLIQLAWHSRNCRNGSPTVAEDADSACLSADADGGVERYRLSFQP
ncbi:MULTISPECIES: type IV pilus modification protein PilV [Pseudomonas]|uniref:Type IV pilus modification protein PilV n=2 Tax=Pseudomonas nitroreducens TaxID=46680 RepID=A0A6G6IRD9_PSENT|nr:MULTISPECIES: type IV pilus modification protein PilV [Pseudomonas]NMZ62050.1 type IV pilus modification protein PilV [Pseudomonas nitroreducens]NMZ74877.1 type IV pilus modification protein PilV [Pseudomonas nitroreducens]QIE85564.1 type IV pilus modification protein PilV [Pseudomonas nitroreducens]UCL87934.1 type IV pilus modification protein PilV [Pseudomonas sp. HS-18]WEX00040.1 type IV pilus modification protein PilV [Pseudomonas nitroreducens]